MKARFLAEHSCPKKINPVTTIGGLLVSLAFAAQLITVINGFPGGDQPFPAVPAKFDDVRNVGMTLFSGYNLPFQVVGALVLVATIGVVVLSQRELK